jgi:hypothetical protein
VRIPLYLLVTLLVLGHITKADPGVDHGKNVTVQPPTEPRARVRDDAYRGPSLERFRELVKQLKSDSYAEREAATRELSKWAAYFVPEILEYLRDDRVTETSNRLNTALSAQFGFPTPHVYFGKVRDAVAKNIEEETQGHRKNMDEDGAQMQKDLLNGPKQPHFKRATDVYLKNRQTMAMDIFKGVFGEFLAAFGLHLTEEEAAKLESLKKVFRGIQNKLAYFSLLQTLKDRGYEVTSLPPKFKEDGEKTLFQPSAVVKFPNGHRYYTTSTDIGILFLQPVSEGEKKADPLSKSIDPKSITAMQFNRSGVGKVEQLDKAKVVTGDLFKQVDFLPREKPKFGPQVTIEFIPMLTVDVGGKKVSGETAKGAADAAMHELYGTSYEELRDALLGPQN